MLPMYACHAPSGASTNQLLHYVSLIAYVFFGNYTSGSGDFDLSQIRVPISVHYSNDDTLSNVKDVEKLITKLDSNVARVHIVNQTQFNHIDFIWGIQAAEFVYSKIISFFEDY